MLEAGVLRQQLVQGRHVAGEPGQVDPERPEPGVRAVDQLAQGPGRAAVRGAQRDELAGDLRSAALFDVPAGDQPAHRVAHEHHLGISVRSALVPPPLQGGFDDRGEPLGVVPAGQPPVIGHREQVAGRRAGARFAVAQAPQPGQQRVIAFDRGPDPGRTCRSGMRAAGSTPSPGCWSPIPAGSSRRRSEAPNVAMARSADPADGAQTRRPSRRKVLPKIPGRTTTRSVGAVIGCPLAGVRVVRVDRRGR
jgi:hypothetical protein